MSQAVAEHRMATFPNSGAPLGHADKQKRNGPGSFRPGAAFHVKTSRSVDVVRLRSGVPHALELFLGVKLFHFHAM